MSCDQREALQSHINMNAGLNCFREVSIHTAGLFWRRFSIFYTKRSLKFKKNVPLLEEGEADTDGHVVDAQRNGLSLVWTVLREPGNKTTTLQPGSVKHVTTYDVNDVDRRNNTSTSKSGDSEVKQEREHYIYHQRNVDNRANNHNAGLFVAFRFIRAFEGAGLRGGGAYLRGNSYHLLHPP